MLAIVLSFMQRHWTDQFFGLWQTQQWNLLREKAFNMVAAETSTRCCICSLFETTNQFSTFKHELVLDQFQKLCKKKETASRMSVVSSMETSRRPKSEELRVVVKRILIQLPKTARTGPVESKSSPQLMTEKDEELVTCSSCSICVHRCELVMTCTYLHTI